jgi:hypothetical protein
VLVELHSLPLESHPHQCTISGGAVTIDPPSNIGFALTTFVVVDAGAFAGITTTSTSALINTYSFTTKDLETW